MMAESQLYICFWQADCQTVAWSIMKCREIMQSVIVFY